jgi:Asp-tRNA(Asn)/Glu-tRNA(Gln) amidotransferase A subunit family amidase
MPTLEPIAPVRPLVAGRSNTLASLTAGEFLDRLRRREMTVLDYAAACADVIDLFEPEVRAWAWYSRERFLGKAAKIDEALKTFDRDGRNGQALPGLMTGVPVGVKDIFNTHDMPTGHGSDIFAEYTPGNDARVVFNMRWQGGIVAGKTVTAEFAVHHAGATHNPYDGTRSCGTSSSGSAAAVAVGMVPVALSSQTAGSTIRPSSYCGIYGYKPSYGLLPRTAMLKTTDTLDTVGFMARSVQDLELLFDVMRVRGPNYPYVEQAMKDPRRRWQGDRPWRVGILQGPKSSLESAAARDGIRRLAAALSRAGCQVEDFRLPPEFDRAHEVHETIYRRSLAYYFRLEWASSRDKFSPRMAEMMEAGRAISVDQYQVALAEQARLAARFDEEMKRYDVALCPASADEAPVGLNTPDPADHSLIFTMCYAPSMAVPVMSGTTGLPLGAQIAARRFNDYMLFDFAKVLASVGMASR